MIQKITFIALEEQDVAKKEVVKLSSSFLKQKWDSSDS
jgi:hypothetical protein